MTTNWDIICVGSGITALAFATQIVTRHPGKRLLITEKHYTPGGYATWFRRKKLAFDCSLHKLSGMGEGGNLRRIFEDLGLFDELQCVYPKAFFAMNVGGGEDLVLSNHYPTFKDQLRAEFPQERDGLDRFFQEVETHGRNGYYQFQIMDGTFFPDMKELRHAHKHLRKLTVKQALAERFQDTRLIQLLAAIGIYVGGFEEDLGYLYYLHVVYATLVCGNAYVVGGSQRLSNVLVSRLRQAGGQVLLRTEVSRILVDEDRRARGVVTNRGTFHADEVYINASPHYALASLLPDLPCLEAPRAKLELLKPSWSTSTLYLATDLPPEELGLTHSETMFFSEQGADASAQRGRCAGGADPRAHEEALWESSTMEVTNYHKLDPRGGNVICLNVLDAMAHWPPRDSEAYLEKKERLVKALLGRLLRRKPGLEGHIVYQEASTPHTYQRYTNNHAGAGYGALVGTDASAHLFHHDFPIGGVRFISAWVAGPSYEAAFGYAEMRAQGYGPGAPLGTRAPRRADQAVTGGAP